MAGGPGRNDEPSKASCSPPGAEPTQEPKIPGTTPWEPDTRPEHSLQLPLEKKRYSHNLYYVVNTNNYPSTQRARNYHFLGFYISQDNFLCVPHLTQTTPEKRLGLYPPLQIKVRLVAHQQKIGFQPICLVNMSFPFTWRWLSESWKLSTCFISSVSP